MRSFASFSFRLLEPVLANKQEARRETVRALRAARMRTFPEWYVAQSILAGVLAGVATLVVAAAVLSLAPLGLALATRVTLVVGLAAVAGLLTRLAFLAYPRIRAGTRSRSIDDQFQPAVVMCYALARGGMSTLDVFRVIAAERRTYGEISAEFDMVVRDVEMFGIDVVKALQNAAAATPSLLTKGFFEGLVSILNSGADPRDYFKRQAEVQLSRAESMMEKDLASVGMLAEVYVSSFLVIPLLVLVVLSGLSSLGNGQERYIPYIVYGLIPAGTLFYLVMLEVMMPSPDLAVQQARPQPLVDFGIASIPTRASRAPAALTAGGPRAPVAQRVRAWAARQVRRMEARPMDALEWSAPPALLVLLVGGVATVLAGLERDAMLVRLTALTFVALVLALAPPAFFHEKRVGRAQRIEAALPEMLSKLAGFNERGIGLLQSFQILGRASSGPLAREMHVVDRDVRVNGSLQGAIRRLGERVRTMRMTKLCVLLERASMSTGSMKEVLDIAAADETRTETLRSRKRQTMMSYVLVIYLVFGVFLYVSYMTTSLFYGDASFAIATGSSTNQATRVGQSFEAGTARLLFLDAVVLQGVASGLVAGRLAEGHVLSGVKHAAILGGVALVVFLVGVV